jgi:hypothetical protein
MFDGRNCGSSHNKLILDLIALHLQSYYIDMTSAMSLWKKICKAISKAVCFISHIMIIIDRKPKLRRPSALSPTAEDQAQHLIQQPALKILSVETN